MDRSQINHDLETSIVCLLDSMKHVLSTTENTYIMGANRQNHTILFIFTGKNIAITKKKKKKKN